MSKDITPRAAPVALPPQLGELGRLPAARRAAVQQTRCCDRLRACALVLGPLGSAARPTLTPVRPALGLADADPSALLLPSTCRRQGGRAP